MLKSIDILFNWTMIVMIVISRINFHSMVVACDCADLISTGMKYLIIISARIQSCKRAHSSPVRLQFYDIWGARPGDVYYTVPVSVSVSSVALTILVKARNSVKSQTWVFTSQNAFLMGGKWLIGRFVRPFYWVLDLWNNHLFFRHLVFVAMKRLIQNLFSPGV